MAILGGENTTDEMRERQPVCRVHDSPVRLLGRELGTQLGSQRVFSQNVLEYFLLTTFLTGTERAARAIAHT